MLRHCAPLQATQREGQASAGVHAEHTPERTLSTEAVTESSSIPVIVPTPIFSFPNYAGQRHLIHLMHMMYVRSVGPEEKMVGSLTERRVEPRRSFKATVRVTANWAK